MTAISPDALDGRTLRAVNASLVQRRLDELVAVQRGGAAWWVEVTRSLDDLADSVLSAPGNLIDPAGFTEQIRADAPHLMGRWMRLNMERDRLYSAVTEVRMLAGRHAGDPGAVGAVAHAVREILHRARRFQDRTTEVLLDAYERDMGGE
jgi:hypothetical protein